MLSIITLHSRGSFGAGEWWVAYWDQLAEGVPVFFVISGFLLFRPFVAAETGHAPAIRVRDFYWRRVLRILPGYWLALTVFASIYGLKVTGANAWRYYSLLQAYEYKTFAGGLKVTWSLSVEAWLYIVLPLFVAALGLAARRRWATWRAGLVIAPALIAAIALARWLGIADRPLVVREVTACTMMFLSGMSIAAASVGAYVSPRIAGVFAAVARRSGLCWLAALAAVVIAATGPFNNIQAGPLLDTAAAVLIVLPATIARSGSRLVRSVLSSRVLAWIGLISYGLYLCHTTLIGEIRGEHRASLASAALLTALGWAATFAFATASYYGVELPIMRYGRRLLRRDGRGLLRRERAGR